MDITLLLISDIHGNWPALEAVSRRFEGYDLHSILNCGDSLVYAPFPNQTMDWLRKKKVYSILGNTDLKVRKLLRGDSFKKPSKQEKRVMYTSTATTLSEQNRDELFNMKKKREIRIFHPDRSGTAPVTVGVFHGSPARHKEFLFPTTPRERFIEIAAPLTSEIVVTGHSHTPYHLFFDSVHFINPGSVGRMFDGDPRASCCLLHIGPTEIQTEHFRIPYDIEKTVQALRQGKYPDIYAEMFRRGKKLN